MYLSNARGLWNALQQRPQMISVTALNLRRQLVHFFTRKLTHGQSHPPEQITVVVTDICNLRCKMCQYAFSDAPGYQLNQVGRMDPQLFRKLMDEVPGQPLVSFTGGEPLLHPNISDFVAYATAKGRLCTVTTNGWMLAKRAQVLCEAGLGILVVSVDGPPEVHNQIRGGKSFERLAEGIETLLSLPGRPLVFISMAVSDLNSDKLLEMYELARRWKVDGINFNHLWMQTHDMVAAFNAQFASVFEADEVAWDIHPERVDVDRVADALETIRRRNWREPLLVIETPFLNRREIVDWYRHPAQPVKWGTTRCAWIRMKVWPDGGVKPCREWKAGNVAEAHAMDIWNGPKLKSFRGLLAVQGTLPLCARCCYMAYR